MNLCAPFWLCRAALDKVIASIRLKRQPIKIVICWFVFRIFRFVHVGTDEHLSLDGLIRATTGKRAASQYR